MSVPRPAARGSSAFRTAATRCRQVMPSGNSYVSVSTVQLAYGAGSGVADCAGGFTAPKAAQGQL
ncbi:hypothetical protein AB0G29_22320 [Streptomyces parvus]|uniref:hypothetical protein n=1 Tax=Streptomyces parvus TaxID=66428 RepID=UPI0033E77C95